MNKAGIRRLCVVFVISAAVAVASHAQVFTSLLSFDGSNGSNPYFMSLVQGLDSNYYGATDTGGLRNCSGYGDGTLFRITRMGARLTSFLMNCAQDGSNPIAGLILGTDGSFYGTTSLGGTICDGGNGGCGTVFKITTAGVLTTLHRFTGPDGVGPNGVLVQGADGNFYGTTSGGGAGRCGNGCGTIFKITPQGVFTTLHVFAGPPTEGSIAIAGLVQGTDGNFYGATSDGGNFMSGTIFKINSRGLFATLYSFGAERGDGSFPFGALVEGNDGNFYGTTIEGGGNDCGLDITCGTIFRITPDGNLTTIHTFAGFPTDGSNPFAGLVLATDGNLYGTTANDATIFEITPDGAFTTLFSFSGNDGALAYGGLLQATNGTFYATTYGGGTYNNCQFGCGTVYSLSTGLNPFVAFVHNTGEIGQTGTILGQGFTGTTQVALNGSPVSFAVWSDTFLTATIPAGATTGLVTVTTPTGTLTSNVPFRVLPQLLSFTPPSGPVGTQVTITGVSLTQTTGVGFGDYTPAQFTVNSDTQVIATVPSSAKTGPVGIQTQGGIAISAQTFTVTQ